MQVQTYWPGDSWPGVEGPWARSAETELLWSEKTGWAGTNLSLRGRGQKQTCRARPRALTAGWGRRGLPLPPLLGVWEPSQAGSH